jgi:hypothetical protein
MRKISKSKLVEYIWDAYLILKEENETSGETEESVRVKVR